MPEPQVPETMRLNNTAKADIAELKRVLTAVVKAIKELENETGEPYMPSGEYYGIKFDE